MKPPQLLHLISILNLCYVAVCTEAVKINGSGPTWDSNFRVEHILTLGDACLQQDKIMATVDGLENFAFDVDIGCADWVTSVSIKNSNNYPFNNR